ncbi:hypothetical protein AB0I54_31590 [Streptomyces sp. NPDC050625]|uniref:hypothetical protein n=1 Tax=Streptomyces sp. NPDC050625 TaxID=3154629 RepID=UPI00341E5B6C
MRPKYVPVRLAAAVLAVTAAAGCVNVGEDGGRATPSHSSGRRGGDTADGGSVVSGGGAGYEGAEGDAERRRGRKAKHGKHEPASSAPSRAGSSSVSPAGPGGSQKPGVPAPTQAPPTPTPTPPDPEPPASTPPPPVSTPPTAEPSSSAHEEAGPQLGDREPAPQAGTPA